jgi:hypothetical protein
MLTITDKLHESIGTPSTNTGPQPLTFMRMMNLFGMSQNT